MKTIKVSEATRVVLDYLVSKCEGIDLFPWPNGTLNIYRAATDDYAVWEPHCRWEQGGPIIERECIATYASGACSVAPKNPDYWVAEILDTSEMIAQYGPTPLIAAMRCFVASKLGEVAEVPDELT